MFMEIGAERVNSCLLRGEEREIAAVTPSAGEIVQIHEKSLREAEGGGYNLF